MPFSGCEGVAKFLLHQQTVDTAPDIARSCHCDSSEWSLPLGCKLHQHLSVICPALCFCDRGTIADRFTQIGDFFLQPPAQGAKPKQRSVNSGEQLPVKISLAHV